MLHAGCQYFGLQSAALDATRFRYVLASLQCFCGILKLFAVATSFWFGVSVVHMGFFQVTYHQRMNLSTNMGLIVLFSFASYPATKLSSFSQAPIV